MTDGTIEAKHPVLASMLSRYMAGVTLVAIGLLLASIPISMPFFHSVIARDTTLFFESLQTAPEGLPAFIAVVGVTLSLAGLYFTRDARSDIRSYLERNDIDLDDRPEVTDA